VGKGNHLGVMAARGEITHLPPIWLDCVVITAAYHQLLIFIIKINNAFQTFK
jgi:hypothetical protein